MVEGKFCTAENAEERTAGNLRDIAPIYKGTRGLLFVGQSSAFGLPEPSIDGAISNTIFRYVGTVHKKFHIPLVWA